MPRLAFDPAFAGPSQWAEMYRGLGLQVVPAYLPQPKPAQWKRPAIKEWKQFQEELVPSSLFEKWYGENGAFTRHQNMGLITGRASGNIFVLDLDTYKGGQAAAWWQAQLFLNNHGEIPHCWRSRTGGGGRHLFFKAPEAWVVPNNNTPLGVDIKGQGGFVVLPPSLHTDGVYAWEPGFSPEEVGELEEAPRWLLDAIDELAEAYGGHKSEPRHIDDLDGAYTTPQPSADFNAWGRQIDGRESAMTRIALHGFLEMLRQHSSPTGEEIERHRQLAFNLYLRDVVTRLPNVGNDVGLEREGRGETLFNAKWNRLLRQQGTAKIEAMVARPNPKAEPELPGAAPVQPSGIKVFPFDELVTNDAPEEPDYIEKNLLGAGGFMLIGGPPKAQKSWLVQEIQVAAATGGSFLDGSFTVPRPLRVFSLQAEMNEKLLRRRARVFRGDFSEAQLIALSLNLKVSDRFRMILDEGGVQRAIALIKSVYPDEPPDVLSFDPMANIFDQENENDNAQVMKFLTLRIEAVRQAVNPLAGVILVHHATKKGPDEIRRDPFNCFRGGGALRGHYDSGIIIFRKSAETEEREIHFELRGGESPEPVTVTLENGRMIKALTVFGEPRPGWPDNETQNNILSRIQGGWNRGEPWSNEPRSRSNGRYAPQIINRDYPAVSEAIAKQMINSWLMPDGALVIATYNAHAKLKGLCQRRYAP